jgi:hypothetical protein
MGLRASCSASVYDLAKVAVSEVSKPGSIRQHDFAICCELTRSSSVAIVPSAGSCSHLCGNQRKRLSWLAVKQGQ